MAQRNDAISGGGVILTPEPEKKALKNYVRYVLQEGTKYERRGVLRLIDGKLIVEDGIMWISTIFEMVKQ